MSVGADAWRSRKHLPWDPLQEQYVLLSAKTPVWPNVSFHLKFLCFSFSRYSEECSASIITECSSIQEILIWLFLRNVQVCPDHNWLTWGVMLRNTCPPGMCHSIFSDRWKNLIILLQMWDKVICSEMGNDQEKTENSQCKNCKVYFLK